MTARELESAINEVLRPEYANAGEKQGILMGDPGRPVDRAVFCWSATVEVLERAAKLGAGAVVAHEIPYIPGRGQDLGLPEGHPELPANRRRRELCERHGLVFAFPGGSRSTWWRPASRSTSTARTSADGLTGRSGPAPESARCCCSPPVPFWGWPRRGPTPAAQRPAAGRWKRWVP